MISLPIDRVRQFMNHLLLKQTFDSYYVSEASITTFTTFNIDGRFHPEFYTDDISDEELDNISDEDEVTWNSIRPICLNLIKGKRLPVVFRIVLRLSSDEALKLLEQSGAGLLPDDIYGLYLNIQYKSDQLTVTTGVSLRVFTMDKSLEDLWDETVQRFLMKAELL